MDYCFIEIAYARFCLCLHEFANPRGNLFTPGNISRGETLGGIPTQHHCILPPIIIANGPVSLWSRYWQNQCLLRIGWQVGKLDLAGECLQRGQIRLLGTIPIRSSCTAHFGPTHGSPLDVVIIAQHPIEDWSVDRGNIGDGRS